jgi:hypothetical protein
LHFTTARIPLRPRGTRPVIISLCRCSNKPEQSGNAAFVTLSSRKVHSCTPIRQLTRTALAVSEVDQRQFEAKKLAGSFIPDSTFSIWMTYLFLKMAFMPGFNSIFRRRTGAKSIIQITGK